MPKIASQFRHDHKQFVRVAKSETKRFAGGPG